MYEADLLDARREQTLIRMAAFQQHSAKQYNKNVKEQQYQIRELVLRRVFPNTHEASEGKFSPNYEGSYLVKEITGPGSYQL